MQRARKERNRQRQKDESSLRGLAHCQIVNLKSHNYTQRASANREQQTRERETRNTERMTENERGLKKKGCRIKKIYSVSGTEQRPIGRRSACVYA